MPSAMPAMPGSNQASSPTTLHFFSPPGLIQLHLTPQGAEQLTKVLAASFSLRPSPPESFCPSSEDICGRYDARRVS
jgi:hypothetical protein